MIHFRQPVQPHWGTGEENGLIHGSTYCAVTVPGERNHSAKMNWSDSFVGTDLKPFYGAVLTKGEG